MTAAMISVSFARDIFWLTDVPVISADLDAARVAQDTARKTKTSRRYSERLWKKFITTASGEDFDKIERLMLSISCSKRHAAI